MLDGLKQDDLYYEEDKEDNKKHNFFGHIKHRKDDPLGMRMQQSAGHRVGRGVHPNPLACASEQFGGRRPHENPDD